MYHDQKTSGIMGFLFCVKNMPLGITATDPRNKAVVFKNRRCRLAGWRLHAEDHARLMKSSTPEFKLEYLPEKLFIKIVKATWIWSKDLGPGVLAVKPTTVTWHLDRACKGGVKRRGFAWASDFSGTAHSFAGDTLPAAFVDCLPWNEKPDRAAHVSAYMCLSPVSYIDDVWITQPC